MVFHQLASLLFAPVLLLILVPIQQSDGRKVYERGLSSNIYKQFRIGGKLTVSQNPGDSPVLYSDSYETGHDPYEPPKAGRDPIQPESDTICLDDEQCVYRPQGINAYYCFGREKGLPVGSIEKTFEHHGRAKLTFKNCNDHGNVQVFLNNEPIGISLGKNKMDANFVVKPRDVLELIEENGAIIKVLSLTVERDKSTKAKWALLNEYEEEEDFDMTSINGKKLLVGSAVRSPLSVLLGLKSMPKIVNGKVIAGEPRSARLTLLKKLPVLGKKPTLNQPDDQDL